MPWHLLLVLVYYFPKLNGLFIPLQRHSSDLNVVYNVHLGLCVGVCPFKTSFLKIRLQNFMESEY